MIRPYNKQDLFREKDLTPAERLEPARAAIRHAITLLQQFDDKIAHASPLLTDENLQTICDAAEAAYNAAGNAAFLGHSGFEPAPVKTVGWTKRPEQDVYAEARELASSIDRLAYMVDPYEYFNTVGVTEEDIERHVGQIAQDLLHGREDPYIEWLVELSHDENQDPRDRERAAGRVKMILRFIREKL